MVIPPSLVTTIASALQTGHLCFIHRDTLELVTYPDEDEHPDMDESEWEKEIAKVDASPKSYVKLVNVNTRQRVMMMEEFVETVDSKDMQIKLRTALVGRKPFAMFQQEIDRSGTYEASWLAFQSVKYVAWVQKQLDIIFK